MKSQHLLATNNKRHLSILDERKSRLIFIYLPILFIISITFTQCKSKNSNSKNSTETTINAEPDFRKINWEMSKEEVKKHESLSPLKDEDYKVSYFPITMFGEDLKLIYYFDSTSRLKVAEYNTVLSPMGDIKKIFYSFKSELTSKFGNPFKDTIFSANTKSKIPLEEINNSLVAGDVSLMTVWIIKKPTLSRTIMISLRNTNDIITFAYINSDPKFLKKRFSEIKKEDQENL